MKASFAAALLGFAASTTAAIQQKCQGSICYSLNIPDATVSSGDGDIYMQISGPTSNSWIALGQGGSMKGAQMFIIYTSADGNNVTLSPRLSSGEVTPSYNGNAKVTLLEGSGVSNGQMVANIRCSGCKSWSGGSMDFTSSSTGWIYASLSGSALNSDSPSANIRQHSRSYGTMSFSSQAQGGNSINPFVASSSSSGGSSGGSSAGSSGSSAGTSASLVATSATVRSTGVVTSVIAGSTVLATTTGVAVVSTTVPTSGASTNDGSFSESGSTGYTSHQKMLIAHGVLAGLTFAVLFPLGAVAIRLLSFPGLVAFHGAFQVFAFLVYLCAFGLGVTIASDMDLIHEYHPVIGIILFIVLIFQPILGVLHHKNYARYQRRTFWSHAHLWVGRIAITLGIINGGLGFLLADNTTTGPIVYGVVAGISYLVYLAAIFIGERKKRNAVPRGMPPKYESSPTTRSGNNTPPEGAPYEYYQARK